MLRGGRRADVALLYVVSDLAHRPVARAPPATAAASNDAGHRSGGRRDATVHRLELAVWTAQLVPARLAVLAFPQTPRRAEVAAGHREPPGALHQVRDLGDHADPAAPAPGPARVGPQSAALDAQREAQLKGLNRRVAHVPLA